MVILSLKHGRLRNMSNTTEKQKPLVVPKLKPKNPLGLKRKGTIRHKDKRKESEKILQDFQG
jgi:hypothetical protein